MDLQPIRCTPSCTATPIVIQEIHSSLPPKGKPEFHAEWLRDEPSDATTTCPRKTGVWCQLLPGNGEHEIRGSLQHSWPKRLAFVLRVISRSLFVEPVTRSYRLSHSCNCEGFVTTAYELRCRECGKTYGVQPLSYCHECFSPLEVAFDLEFARTRFTREA